MFDKPVVKATRIERLPEEWDNRAGIIVRGLQSADSGWYNSPDDLRKVIAEQLSAAYVMGKRHEITFWSNWVETKASCAAKSKEFMRSNADKFREVGKRLTLVDLQTDLRKRWAGEE